jgi:hypothetical protein
MSAALDVRVAFELSASSAGSSWPYPIVATSCAGGSAGFLTMIAVAAARSSQSPI